MKMIKELAKYTLLVMLAVYLIYGAYGIFLHFTEWMDHYGPVRIIDGYEWPYR